MKALNLIMTLVFALLFVMSGHNFLFAQANAIRYTYSGHNKSNQYKYARKIYVEHCAKCHDGKFAPTAEQMQEHYKGRLKELKSAMRLCRAAMKLPEAQRRALEKWLSE